MVYLGLVMQTGRGGSVQFTFSVREGFGSALLLNSDFVSDVGKHEDNRPQQVNRFLLWSTLKDGEE